MIVPGDVNSTLAAALACAHLRVPLAHVEAGLRCFDRTMPEEVNRVLVDQVSDLLFTHSPEALSRTSRARGSPAERVQLVGNTMIDSLVALEDRFRERARLRASTGVEPGSYLLVTLHRPALVDGDLLEPAIERLAAVASEMPVALPGPPADPGRARRRRPSRCPPGLRLIEPVGYLDFLSLEADAPRGAHRLRRHPGGDDLPRRPLLHAARQHRAADHDRARGRTRCSASIRRGSPRSRRCSRTRGDAPGGAAAALGRSRRRAARRRSCGVISAA